MSKTEYLLKCNEAARKQVHNISQMDHQLRLLMEIASRAGAIGAENLADIAEELDQHFGGAAAAIEAIKSGAISLTSAEYGGGLQ